MTRIAEALAHGLGDALRWVAEDKLAGLLVQIGVAATMGGG